MKQWRNPQVVLVTGFDTSSFYQPSQIICRATKRRVAASLYLLDWDSTLYGLSLCLEVDVHPCNDQILSHPNISIVFFGTFALVIILRIIHHYSILQDASIGIWMELSPPFFDFLSAHRALWARLFRCSHWVPRCGCGECLDGSSMSVLLDPGL